MTAHSRPRVAGLWVVALTVAMGAALATAVPWPANADEVPRTPSRSAVLIYVVPPTTDSSPESLADIARRFLPDPGRQGEILALNQGIVQRDGGALPASGELRVGWILQVPEDAQGPDLQLGVMPPQAASTVVAQRSASVWWWAALILGAIALCVALVWLIARRLRRGSSPAVTSHQTETAGPLAWTIDRAMRALAAQTRLEGSTLPDAYLLRLDADTVSVRLTAPRNTAPTPWSVRDDGKIWAVPLRSLQSVPLNDGPSPYPLLVTLSASDGVVTLLNLGEARGLLTVDGKGDARRLLLEQWIHELMESPWSTMDRPVVHIGFGELSPGSGTSATWEEAVLVVSQNRGGVLFSADPPPRLYLKQLNELVRAPDASWTFVIGGSLPHARWRFTIGNDGRLDTSMLNESIDPGLESTPPLGSANGVRQ